MSREEKINMFIDKAQKITQILIKNNINDEEITYFTVVMIAYYKANMPLLFSKMLDMAELLAPLLKLKKEEI